MSAWYAVVTLLSDEAVATLTRGLVEVGFEVKAGFGEGRMLANPHEGTTWAGRVAVLCISRSDNLTLNQATDLVVKAGARINYLSITVTPQGSGLNIRGAHLVDDKEPVPDPADTAYAKLGE